MVNNQNSFPPKINKNSEHLGTGQVIKTDDFFKNQEVIWTYSSIEFFQDGS